MYEVVVYTENLRDAWNSFLLSSKNSSFLFNRNFMEYHSSKFQDHSLLVLKGGKIIGMLPANLKKNIIYSHEGLTFGAFILDKEIKLNNVLIILFLVTKYLHDKGIQKFIFKAFPRIYNYIPADEIEWGLSILNAKLIRKDISLAIVNTSPLDYQERRYRAISKAEKLCPVIKSDDSFEFENFWNSVLKPHLLFKYGVLPVHSVEEIKMLALLFPKNIKQFNIYVNNQIMAGCTIFINQSTVHAQYISSTEDGRKNGCLDYLFNYLIKEIFHNYSIFDFGICNEENGKKINHGLLDWKEGFGGRAISYDFYEIDTTKYTLLKNVINCNSDI